MNKQKGLAPILVVILIALAVSGYFLYQKQTKPTVISQPVVQPTSVLVISPVVSNSAETANWKTYSRIVNFTFQFPNDWAEQPNYSLQSSNKLMTIWIEGETVGLECLTLIKTENRTLNDTDLVLKYYDGVKSDNCDTQGNKIIFFLFTVDSKKYSFIFDYKDSNKEVSEKLFAQILSTLKFIN